jgi:hypothetical protein
LASWSNALPEGHPAAAYCVHGHEVSHGVAGRCRRRKKEDPRCEY